MQRGRVATLTALATLLPQAAMAQAPSLATVLERAGAYVAGFHRQLSSVVAEEHAVQDARTPPPRKLVVPTLEHRELHSDVLLVNVTGTNTWLQFRDVYAVDGEPVRDRTDRLMNLFMHPSSDAAAQVEAILAESARYNVGSIQRTVNTPIIPLAFLESANRRRFRFFRSADRRPGAAPIEAPAGSSLQDPFRVATDAWVIRFEETARPTLIRTRNDKNLPSHGRFWVDPATGRVLMTELIAEDRLVRGTITVTYRSDPLLGMLLPAEMRERYEGRRSKAVVEASASYGRFRRFQVNVDETFAPLRRP
jgi:hypothetical protein